MRRNKKVIFALILLLAIGFAAVTTTLVINGTSLFGANNDDFDVIFTKAIVDGEDKSSEVISTDGKTITYTTSELAIKDDESILDFTVKNNSTQYDAEVVIECIGGASVGTYYKIDKSVAELIYAQTTDEGQVIVTMLKSSTEPIEEEFTCTITATAIERDEAGATTCSVVNPPTECNEVGDVCWTDSDCSRDKNIGDIVSLGTEENSIEQFYILTSSNENITMMSMYNLYVGGEYDPSTSVWTAYENPTGLQSSLMLGGSGYVADLSIMRGTTAFSSDEQKGEKLSDYTGSIVESYVNNYGMYISDTLGIENTATLISKEDLEEILGRTLYFAENLSWHPIVPKFLYSTTYWLRSGRYSNQVWYIRILEGQLYDAYTYITSFIGVRPVITISSSLV